MRMLSTMWVKPHAATSTASAGGNCPSALSHNRRSEKNSTPPTTTIHRRGHFRSASAEPDHDRDQQDELQSDQQVVDGAVASTDAAKLPWLGNQEEEHKEEVAHDPEPARLGRPPPALGIGSRGRSQRRSK
jgi:hypothetical protein